MLSPRAWVYILTPYSRFAFEYLDLKTNIFLSSLPVGPRRASQATPSLNPHYLQCRMDPTSLTRLHPQHCTLDGSQGVWAPSLWSPAHLAGPRWLVKHTEHPDSPKTFRHISHTLASAMAECPLPRSDPLLRMIPADSYEPPGKAPSPQEKSFIVKLVSIQRWPCNRPPGENSNRSR